jgi:hypothetical protein
LAPEEIKGTGGSKDPDNTIIYLYSIVVPLMKQKEHDENLLFNYASFFYTLFYFSFVQAVSKGT